MNRKKSYKNDAFGWKYCIFYLKITKKKMYVKIVYFDPNLTKYEKKKKKHILC